jgi:hypothetical protein
MSYFFALFSPLRGTGFRGAAKNEAVNLDYVKPTPLAYSSALEDASRFESTLYQPWIYCSNLGACGMPNSIISYRLRDWNYSNNGQKVHPSWGEGSYHILSDLFAGMAKETMVDRTRLISMCGKLTTVGFAFFILL